jgi:hypothetical protein
MMRRLRYIIANDIGQNYLNGVKMKALIVVLVVICQINHAQEHQLTPYAT